MRANCEIQVVIDHYACVEYLTKYAADGESKSQSMNQLFKAILQNKSSEKSAAKKAIKKLAMKALGEIDFSAQETMHLLMSLKLHSCSFKVLLDHERSASKQILILSLKMKDLIISSLFLSKKWKTL